MFATLDSSELFGVPYIKRKYVSKSVDFLARITKLVLFSSVT